MIRKIGVVGGGQLGQMMGLAGVAMGFDFRFWDPAPSAPAGAVGELFQADFDDVNAADEFAAGLDVITYEFENIPAPTIERLAALAPCRPGELSLSTSQDRVVEKSFFNTHGIRTSEWRAVGSLADLQSGFDEFGESILKTRRFGYDGKGQVRLQKAADLEEVWAALGAHPLILEKLVLFDRELSIVGVRAVNGDVASWPLVENEHRSGILHKTIAPAPGVSAELQNYARQVVESTMTALGHVGVLTIEFFEISGQLLANEMAPRPHNSGHWSIEGAVASQFENHVRAVAELPLGCCTPRFASVMINCIGHLPAAQDVAAITGAHYHDYGKSPRKGRKVGHVTVCDEAGPAADDGAFERAVAEVERLCVEATEAAGGV